MKKVIKLSWPEVLMGATVGLMRQISSLKEGRKDKHGFEKEGWTEHIEGALGEIAFAKAIGVFWSGSVNQFKDGGDVGKFQIKTRSRHEYELIIRDDDIDDDAMFVLVTGKCPHYTIHGQIRCGDGKRKEWRKAHANRPEAWFVPHDALVSLDFKVSDA